MLQGQQLRPGLLWSDAAGLPECGHLQADCMESAAVAANEGLWILSAQGQYKLLNRHPRRRVIEREVDGRLPRY